VSQFVVDDQLDAAKVLEPIRRYATVRFLRELRPDERILDDRVPEILQTRRQPTFVTIDEDFWRRRWCHPAYGILYFALREDQQEQLPDLLRALLRRPEFRTRSARMGKLVRVSTISIDYWQVPPRQLHHIAWRGASRRGR
jgi:hypothetical protein